MQKTIISIFLFLFFFPSNQIYGEHLKIDVAIHARVDTTKKVIKEIAELWIDYLNSKPDSLYDNPYWNKVEKLKYTNFDFSIPFLYKFSSDRLLGYYKPTILSIEKEGEYYGIRTMFAAEGLEGEYKKSNPWCITKLYAIRENGNWKLKNALPVITESWTKKTIGKITFIYPPIHNFDEDLANKANQFCNQISGEYQFPEWKSFDFYITKSGDELGKLLNFDFYYASYTTGVGMSDSRILLSGEGSEYYPHEFIHLLVPDFDRHALIEEGFATWKGGQEDKTFEESANILANAISLNQTITFAEVLDKKWGWQYYAYYTTGAIFIKIAYDKGGIVLVKKLLETPNDNRKLILTICSVFGIEEKEIDSFWRREVIKYKTK
jgi:hypothetical protein